MAELIVKNLSKTFGAVKALTDCEFSAHAGEVHAVMGENGAGKSTLMKVLSGVVKPDCGQITWKGEPLTIDNPKSSIKQGVGTVFQELSLIPDLTVAQNVFYENWQTRGLLVSKKALNARTLKLFSRYGIDNIDPKAVVSTLPLSHQQMVEIMKVIARDPEIIIMDEATSALSGARVEWLLELCQKLAKEQNKLVLFITHRLQEINKGCDRITVLRNGEHVGVRRMDETDNDELVTMMLGRSMDAYYPKRIETATDIPMLEVENLNAGKGLIDVNFTIHKGEILGLGGLAGQGQSELFSALFGIINTTGDIKIDGNPVKFKHPIQALRQGVALVPEDRSTQGLVLGMSIRENMSICSLQECSKLGIVDRKKEDERINDMVSTLQIKCGSAELPANSMSGGNQQKTVLGKFLLTKPRILLLFDVTRGVDVGTKMEIFTLTRELAKQGNAILFYSTDLEELVNLCDRVAIMCDNTINATLELKDIDKTNILKASVGESVH